MGSEMCIRDSEKNGSTYVPTPAARPLRHRGVKWAFFGPYDNDWDEGVEQTLRVKRADIINERDNMEPDVRVAVSKLAINVIRHLVHGFTFDQCLHVSIKDLLEYFSQGAIWQRTRSKWQRKCYLTPSRLAVILSADDAKSRFHTIGHRYFGLGLKDSGYGTSPPPGWFEPHRTVSYTHLTLPTIYSV